MTLEEKGFNRLLRQRGRDLKVVLGAQSEMGKILRATVNRIGAYEISSDFGNDPRGKRILETPAATCPVLNSQNTLQDQQNQERYTVVDIGLDSPDYSKKFLLLQLTGKDT